MSTNLYITEIFTQRIHRYMNIMYAPGIPSSDDYPYEAGNAPDRKFKCRYNRTTSAATTTGYGRIKPLNETLLQDTIAAIGPVAFALNAVLDSFLYYR